MNQPIPTKENFSVAYKEKKVSALKWVSGAASSELVWKEKIAPGSSILEVGCGVGTEAVFLAVRGMRVTAIDIAEESLAIGRKLAEVYDVDVDFQQADVLHLPFRDGSFEVVCDRGCFHCFKGKEKELFASEIARVCKSGGLFVLRCFSECNEGHSWVIPNGSKDLISLFSKDFDLEHLERIHSLPKPDGKRSEAWYSIWKKL